MPRLRRWSSVDNLVTRKRRHLGCGPAGRPCRRSVINWVRAFLHAATARAARSIGVVRGSQRRDPCHGHRVLGLAPSLARGCAYERWASRARSGRKAQSAPSCRRSAPRSSPEPRRARVPPAGRTRARLHRRKRRHTEDAPMPRRLARKCHRGQSGGQLVLASDATAWSLHRGKWRRQLADASAAIVHKASARP